MTVLWPRLPASVAEHEFENLSVTGPDHPRYQHAAQIYTPVGGVRATRTDVQALITRVTDLAKEHGFPDTSQHRTRVAFDRAAAPLLRTTIDLNWSEAGQRDTWSFVALVALPHLTRWRFGVHNIERWVATDLTRHTWARLWWQGVVFESDPDLLGELSESDLNQLLERRTLGGDPRIICFLARAVLELTPDGENRRPVIRDVTARLLRRLGFLDTAAMSDADLATLCRTETAITRQRLAEGRSVIPRDGHRHSDR